jgi:hypothetical protein
MIKRTPEKTTQLSVAQYQGQARPGEVVIDESTYQMYVANATGDLNLVGSGSATLNTTQIVNGVSNVAIPLAGANIHVGVSGVANVVNFGQTQVDFKANIVPVGDAVYSLGGPANQFKDLWLSNSTLYLNLIPISITGANTLSVDGANVLTDDGSGTAAFGNVAATGNLLAGNITTPGNVATGNLSVSNQLIACVSVTTDSIVSRTGSLTFSTIGTDQNVTLRPSGNGVVSVDSSRITNIDQPVDANDAATKAYVDAVLSGLIVHQSVAAATTGPLSGSYSPGIGGVGATFTLTVPSNFLDGYALQAGDRILIKDQLTPYENGVYIRSTTSVFTRATDFDTTTDFDRAFVFISNGTINNRTGWVQAGSVVTVGGSDVLFYQYSAASNYTPGTGLTMVGSQFRLANTTVTAGVYGNATTIPSITVDPQGRLIGVANVAVDRNGANITGTSLNSNVLTSNLTQLGILTSLNVGGVSNLGAVGNVIILGGTAGQVLTTNGAGNLAWSPFPTAVTIANGVSNVNIPIGGGNIVVTAGTVNSANITASGIVAANLTSNGNVTTSNLSVANKSNLGSVSNVTITGGFAGYVLTTDGAGVLTWGPGGGGSGYAIANGSSNVTIDTINGNVKFGVNGTADVLIVSDLGANITGLLGADNAIITGNLTVAGNVNYINVDSLQVVDPVISLGGGANGVPLTVNDGKDRGALLNYYTTQQVRAFMGWDNSAGEFAFGSNVSNVNDVMTFNALGNVRASTFIGNLAGETLALTGTSNLNQIANVTILGGTSGQVMTTDGFGTLTWTTPATGTPNSIANGTTTVTIPTASDAIIFTSNGVQIANMWSDTTIKTSTFTGTLAMDATDGNVDFTNSRTTTLGPVGNIKITGGTVGQILTATGVAGGIQWSNPSAGSIISNGFSNITIPTVSGNITHNVAGVKIIDANVDTITVQNGVNLVMGSGTADFSAVTKTKLGATSQIEITGGTGGQVLSTDGAGVLSWATVGAGSLANGTSNVVIPAVNGMVQIHANGQEVVSFYSDTTTRTTSFTERVNFLGNGLVTGGGNVSFGSGPSPLSNVDFQNTHEVYLGPIGNVKISGGSMGQVLTTDGAGVLTWTTAGSGLANGTSNVTIPLVNDTVYVYANGQLVAEFFGDSTGATTTTISGNFVVKGITATGSNSVWFGDAANPIDYVHMDYVGALRLPGAANLSIGGGSLGYVLTTNGSGGLYWGSAGGSIIANGTSNVTIPTSSSTIGFYSNGDKMAEFYSSAGIRNVDTYGHHTAIGSGTSIYRIGLSGSEFSLLDTQYVANVNLGPVANVHITGGTSGQVLTTDGAGVLSWTSGSSGLANGTSNVTIPSVNGSVNINANGVQLASFYRDATTSTTSITGDTILYGDNGTSNLQVGGSGPGQGFALADFRNVSNVSLGPVANVKITGGTSGQILSTNGSGTLSWTTPSSGSIISNGTSNVTISASNGNIRAYVGGNLFQTWAYNSSSFTDEVQFNTPIVRAKSGSYVLFDAAAQTALGSNANVVITGGTNGQFLKTDGTGVLSWATPDAGAVMANGLSNVSISSLDGPIDSYVSSTHVTRLTASTITVYGQNIVPSANLNADLGAGGGGYWDNLFVNTGMFANSVRTGGIKLAGSIQWLGAGSLDDLGDPSTMFKNTYTGNIYTSNIYAPSSVNDITVYGANLLPNANITYNLGSATQRWKDIYLSNNTIYLGESVLTVDGGNLTVDGNTVVIQSTTGGNTVIEGNIVAPGDITSNGNVVAGNLITAGTLDVSGSANLGLVGNITILGGTSGQVLTTDGTGVLSWTTVSGGGGGGDSISNGNSSVNTYNTGLGGVTIAANNFVSVAFTANADGSNRAANFYGTLKVANAGAGFPGGVNFTEAANVALGAVGNLQITGGSNGQVLTTNGSGGLSWTTVSGGGGGGSSISNANSSISTYVDSFVMNADNFTIFSGYGNALNSPSGAVGGVFGGWKYDMFSGARWNFSNASNVTLSSIANLHILGGTSGQVLSTDGAGNLSWATAGGGGGSPGGANTQLQFNDAGSFGGTGNLTFDKTTNTLTTVNITANGVIDFSGSSNVTIGTNPFSGEIVILRQNVGITGTNTAISGTTQLVINGSKWPSGYGTGGQVLSTDGNGVLSWANAGSGGAPTYIENGSSTIGFDGANGNIVMNAGSAFLRVYKDGTFSPPAFGNTRANISGTVTEIQGNPFPSSGSGSVVVWTATNTPVGAKMTLRAQHSDGNIQMMEIMMAKQGSTVVHTVSNRLKTNSGADDIGISVALNSGNLEVTAACGGSTYQFTHSVTQFEATV